MWWLTLLRIATILNTYIYMTMKNKANHGLMYSPTLSSLKAQFLAVVKEHHIGIDWDAGDCYSFVKHPIMSQADQLSSTDEDKFLQWTEEWLSENSPTLYNMCHVVNGQLMDNWGKILEGAEAKEHLEGLFVLLHGQQVDWSTTRLRELQDYYKTAGFSS